MRKMHVVLAALALLSLGAVPVIAATVTPGGTTPYAWYRADMGVATVGGGDDTVTSWADQSGSGRNLGTIDGDPQLTGGVVVFDGDDRVSDAAATWGTAGAGTVFAVWQRTSEDARWLYDPTADKQRQTLWYNGSSLNFGGTVYTTSPSNWDNNLQSVSDTVGMNNWAVTSVSHTTGTSDTFRIDGSTVYTGDLLSGGMTGLRVGSYIGSNTASWWIGDIAELIVFEGALSDSERLATEQALGDRWGVDVVPEPTTWLMLTIGLAVLSLGRYTRKKRA